MNQYEKNISIENHTMSSPNRIFVMMLSVCFLSIPMSGSVTAEDPQQMEIKIGWMDNMFDHTLLVDVRAGILFWVEEIAKQTGKGNVAEGVIYNDINTIIGDLKSDKVDLVNCKPLDYLTIAEQVKTELAYARIEDGKISQKFLLLVHSDNPVTELAHLQGTTLSVRSSSQIELLYLNTLLLQNNLQETGEFFSSIVGKNKTPHIIYSVFFKKIDCCVVAEEIYNMMVELNPQVGKDLKILTTSPEIVNEVAFFRKSFDDDKQEQALEAMTHLREIPKGDYVLTLFKTEGLKPIQDSDLDTLRAMVALYDSLTNKNNKDIIRNVQK